MEADARAAAVVNLAERLQLALRLAALERHLVELLLARDLDFEQVRQRVHHRHADAVQPARGLIDLGVEFAARMERAHDHFERRLLREFRMRIDRDAAAVVDDGEEAVGGEFDLDEGRVPRQRLVHAVVDHLREKVMQRLLVGAADIHAGPAADGLETFQNLDVTRGVIALGAGGACLRSATAAPPNRSSSFFVLVFSALAIGLQTQCQMGANRLSFNMPWKPPKNGGRQRNAGSRFLLDAFSSREPVPTPDQVQVWAGFRSKTLSRPTQARNR